jgi:hypothetical protein
MTNEWEKGEGKEEGTAEGKVESESEACFSP